MSIEHPFSQGSGIVERRLHFRPTQGQLVAADRPPTDGFIKGPLPLSWMTEAAQLPGKTLQVALALWYLSGLKKTYSVVLTSKTASLFGISRDAKYEAIDRLVKAGLVTVQQAPGKAPIVTLVK
ncbi:hypothetical protein [Malikia spinosa]|uniref:Helix-turn-helix domain-containing protein n=1 Tax=Malikia spinosa TaxID=86180 RepID=A0A7C9MV88_9BURK|nr:hypothetical protein [Malikia spinosa]MYZ52116.1 hypothetical protein [Malikia spinosa]